MLIDLRRTETSGEHHHHGLAVRLREQVAEGIPLEAVAESLLAPYEDGDYSVTVVMEDTQADRAACPGRSVGPDAAFVVLAQRFDDLRKRSPRVPLNPDPSRIMISPESSQCSMTHRR